MRAVAVWDTQLDGLATMAFFVSHAETLQTMRSSARFDNLSELQQ
jgi:hypothetical protein